MESLSNSKTTAADTNHHVYHLCKQGARSVRSTLEYLERHHCVLRRYAIRKATLSKCENRRTMKTTVMTLAICLLSLVSISFAQQDTTWNRWNWLVGEWGGEGSGAPGQGTGWFSFLPNLNGKIMLGKSHSEYPATKDKPETFHDDLIVVYLDNANQPDKAIYFDNEGHTINYTITYSDQAIVFTSDKAQNAPVFRLTYILLDKETVDTKFEKSQDGKKFLTYIEGRCRRKN